jgi:phenylacetate-coenzyme A ligase PaaK-like adenylate-forming protein
MSILHTLRFASQTARLGKVPRWSPRRVQRLAQRRLQSLVRYAVRHSPFFREKYAGIDLRRFSLADLPITTKQELRANFDASLTDPQVRLDDIERFLADSSNIGRWFQDRYSVSHTSGSQGLPMILVQERRSLELLFSLMSARANASRPGVLEGIRRLRSPARVAVVAQHRGFYPSAAAFEFMAAITKPLARVAWFSTMDPELAESLNEYQPTILVGYASVLEGLSLQSEHLQLRKLKQIANSIEQLTDRARTRIQQRFGVPVLDHYGIGECLFLSDGCRTHGGAHINSDWVTVEVVDDQYRPVPAGEIGSKVLITNLANRIQPFIRYEVPDRIVMATEACTCGSRLPRIERIDGRSAEAFWIHDAARGYRILPGVLFHNAIDALGDVREWRAVQTERNQIELQLEFLSAAERRFDAFAFVQRLRDTGLPEAVHVEVESVLGLQADPQTGKFRRMISLLGPPERLAG